MNSLAETMLGEPYGKYLVLNIRIPDEWLWDNLIVANEMAYTIEGRYVFDWFIRDDNYVLYRFSTDENANLVTDAFVDSIVDSADVITDLVTEPRLLTPHGAHYLVGYLITIMLVGILVAHMGSSLLASFAHNWNS